MNGALVLYTRQGCHLCEQMHAALAPLLRAESLSLAVIDIDADAELRRAYDRRVPVLALDGEVVCEGRFDEDALRDALKLS